MPHFSHPSRFGLLACLGLAWLVSPAISSAQDHAKAYTPEAMKPYAEKIQGTSLKFDMVPIPGGTFMMGSPESEADRRKNEGPQRRSHHRPVLDGQASR